MWPIQLWHKEGEDSFRSYGLYSYGIRTAGEAIGVMAYKVRDGYLKAWCYGIRTAGEAIGVMAYKVRDGYLKAWCSARLDLELFALEPFA